MGNVTGRRPRSGSLVEPDLGEVQLGGGGGEHRGGLPFIRHYMNRERQSRLPSGLSRSLHACLLKPRRLAPYTLRRRAETMAATRQRITDAAVDLHGSVGPARTTISAVAERAGVQRHTVYRHFPTEDDLFAACSAHYFAAHPWPDPDAWRAIADPEHGSPTASTRYTPTTSAPTRCRERAARRRAGPRRRVRPRGVPRLRRGRRARSRRGVGRARPATRGGRGRGAPRGRLRDMALPGARGRRQPGAGSRADLGVGPARGRALGRRERARARLGDDVARAELGAAPRARQVARDLAAALAMADDARAPRLGRVVAIAPLQQGHHDRPQVEALLGQAVLEARGAVLVGHALEDALVDEAAEAVGEDVARDAEVALEVVEAAHAHERLAHDEDRPAAPRAPRGPGRSSSSGLRRCGAAWLGSPLLAAGPSTGRHDQCSPIELRHATDDGRSVA